jgi:hypothetical protein
MRFPLVVFGCLMAFFLSAQENPGSSFPDPRLSEVYDAAYLENLRIHNPTLLLRWQYYLDHAFTVVEWPDDKGPIDQLPVVRIPDPANINILALEQTQPLHRDWDKPTFYRINNSRNALMYYPGNRFNQAFRAWMQNQ